MSRFAAKVPGNAPPAGKERDFRKAAFWLFGCFVGAVLPCVGGVF